MAAYSLHYKRAIDFLTVNTCAMNNICYSFLTEKSHPNCIHYVLAVYKESTRLNILY